MYATRLSRKQRFDSGFLAGLVAGIIATCLMLLLSVTVGGISLPEVFGAALTQLMPPSLFNYLHKFIGGDAKHYFFYGIIVGQCLIFALSGGLCSVIAGSRNSPEQLHWTVGVLLGFILWLLTGGLLLPLIGAGFFGAQLFVGAVNTIVSLTVIGLVFGVVFIFMQNWLVYVRTQSVEAKDSSKTIGRLSRRVVLWRSAEVLGLGILGVLAWRFITGDATTTVTTVPQFVPKITPPPIPNYGAFQPVQRLSAEITPNNQYYTVSKNLFADPIIDANAWHLTVGGQVERPYTLTYKELVALPMKQQYESMMCISNEVGGEYMSSALWKGVPLADLLARAGSIKPGASKVILYAVDDYSDSIHLSKALEPTTLVAVHMNGASLPQVHGFPARLLVPGIYGMKHVKWITHIEVVNTDYQGYWQQRGWSDAAPIRMASRIDTPLTNETLPANKLTYIAGVAFAGDKGISEVDVSVDGGQTWQPSTLKHPLSALTWVLWEFPWQPRSGSYAVVVRAIDLDGNVQDPNLASPLPDGSSGYHTIQITIV